MVDIVVCLSAVVCAAGYQVMKQLCADKGVVLPTVTDKCQSTASAMAVGTAGDPYTMYVYLGVAGYQPSLDRYKEQVSSIARKDNVKLHWSFGFFRDGCINTNRPCPEGEGGVRDPSGNFDFFSGSFSGQGGKENMRQLIQLVKEKQEKVWL